MRHGSLFSGIGGFDLAAQRCGFENIWQVEIDPYARKVLEKNFPDTKRFEDVYSVGAHNLETVDIISGGFPCQDISNAGKRAGIEGRRSGLWGEYSRIICELRPKLVVVENVPALTFRGLYRVLGDLAEIGYDAEWTCIRASAVGAEHRRDRLWLIAYPDGVRKLQPKRRKQKIRRRNSNRNQEAAANTVREGLSRRGKARANGPYAPRFFAGRGPSYSSTGRISRDYWKHQPLLGGRLHGIPRRVDRIRGLGNSIVPQVAEWIFNRIKVIQ